MNKPLPPDAAQLHRWFTFLQSEVQHLLGLKKPWATGKAQQFTAIADYIREERSKLMMTTVGGKRLEENDLTPHLGKMHDT